MRLVPSSRPKLGHSQRQLVVRVAVNTTAKPLELLLPKDRPPISNTEMWAGICTTVLVMTLVGIWFIGAL